jgi:hypothetical protein
MPRELALLEEDTDDDDDDPLGEVNPDSREPLRSKGSRDESRAIIMEDER